MICENCNCEHDGSYGSGRFCSCKCARGFSTREKRVEITRKRTEANKGRSPWNKLPDKFCKDCGSKIRKRSTSFLCKKCAPKYNNILIEKRNNLSNAAKKNVREGRHQGWKTRNISSYPEIFFKRVVENNNLKYKFNHPVSKKSLGVDDCSSYFLDFYFEELKLDLEIDGKQHNYEDRIESDKERDSLLIENGYIVYRIKWKSINNENGKAYIRHEIEKFLKFFDNLVKENNGN